MKTIAYARISTQHQQLDSQINALQKFGFDYLYSEQDSGRKTNRSELNRALEHLEPGDTFVIYKLDRLSRGTKHLLQLMEYFDENDIEFVSIQNNINTKTPMGKFFFTIMSAFAEMEADLIRDRVLSGLEAAKEKGVILGRPPLNKNIDSVIKDYLSANFTVTDIAKRNGISRPTVYRYLRVKGIDYKSKKN